MALELPEGHELSRPEIRLHYEPHRLAWAVFLLGRRGNAATHLATNVVFEPIEENRFMEPTFQLAQEDVQALMDSLWRGGVRPTDHRDESPALAAVQAHVEDLRSILRNSDYRRLPASTLAVLEGAVRDLYTPRDTPGAERAPAMGFSTHQVPRTPEFGEEVDGGGDPT